MQEGKKKLTEDLADDDTWTRSSREAAQGARPLTKWAGGGGLPVRLLRRRQQGPCAS